LTQLVTALIGLEEHLRSRVDRQGKIRSGDPWSSSMLRQIQPIKRHFPKSLSEFDTIWFEDVLPEKYRDRIHEVRK